MGPWPKKQLRNTDLNHEPQNHSPLNQVKKKDPRTEHLGSSDTRLLLAFSLAHLNHSRAPWTLHKLIEMLPSAKSALSSR